MVLCKSQASQRGVPPGTGNGEHACAAWQEAAGCRVTARCRRRPGRFPGELYELSIYQFDLVLFVLFVSAVLCIYQG